MKEKIKKILKKFEEIETEFNKLSPIERDQILNQHKEGFSLNFCFRWGLQACDDILEGLK